ncbi:MAG: DNA-binding response regulator [Myxococcales bacterium]|nr:DNA-binding response regulator [Myxococcales bacterium]
MQHHILLADDEPNIRRVLAAMLKREGYKVRAVSDGAEAMAELKLKPWSAVITDLKMPRVDGMQLLQHVIEHYPDTPVVIITAHGSIGGAVDALKVGAFDYITKPFEQEDIQNSLRKAIRMRELNEGAVHSSQSGPLGDDPATGRFGIIGRSTQMQEVFTIIDRVAGQPSTVLITGESGTGKELVAKALHHSSDRSGKPFIRINCAAIPTNLMESELFGYEKGAFTGADHAKPGRFELADGGTLFLDEIGEISMEMQVKLLRALQESEFERVGGLKTIRVNVRLVAATNRDLQEAIKQGEFREDLYYRLNVVPIHLPPLCDRADDIPLLVEHFIQKYNDRLQKEVESLSDEAVEVLKGYAWPGNIRELENVLERTMLFSDGEVIEADDLPTDLVERSSELPIPSLHIPAGGDTGLKEVVKETTSRIEREYIIRALEETGGNVTQAAKRLKISRKSLQNKMKEFNLREDS